MNVWLVLPNDVVNRVKSIAETLHNASLMYVSTFIMPTIGLTTL